MFNVSEQHKRKDQFSPNDANSSLVNVRLLMQYLTTLHAITVIIHLKVSLLTVTWQIGLVNKYIVRPNGYIKHFLSVIIVLFLSFSISLRETVGVSPQWQTVRFDICVYPPAKNQTGYIYSGQTGRRREQRAGRMRERERIRNFSSFRDISGPVNGCHKVMSR